MIRKRREECIVFLDDCFDSNSSHSILVAAGFKVERFRFHFPDLDRGNSSKEHNVKDPRVIRLCAKNGYLLITTDREMRKTFIEELKRSEIAVLATANNNDGDDVWANRIADKRAQILRNFKKSERPYFSVIQRSGAISIEVLTFQMTTRRTRPQEQEQQNLSAMKATEGAP